MHFETYSLLHIFLKVPKTVQENKMAFAGSFVLTSNENYDAFLKSIGKIVFENAEIICILQGDGRTLKKIFEIKYHLLYLANNELNV